MKLSSFKTKNRLIFPEMELSSLTFFLYFRRELSELKNQKKKKKKKKNPALKKFFTFRKWNLKNSYILREN